MISELNLSYLQTLDDATILVVDDQPINIQVIYQILGDQFQILMATTGAEAIKVCKKSMPDLVLMDVVMPEKDGLTGVYNRRFFDQYLHSQLAVCKRLQQPIAILIIDIDHFKKYNDHLGHLAGDDALKLVAQRLKQTSKRPADLVARYGGEEFICVLPNTDTRGATHLAEQMLIGIRDLAIDHPTSPLGKITISIGVAATTDYKVNLIQRADEQLYLAKKNGGNQYCIAPETSIANSSTKPIQ